MHRQMGEELLEPGCAERARVAAAMKFEVAPEPLQVRLLGPQCEVARAHALARERQQPGARIQVDF
jgi:hypothetical protein